MVRSPERTEPAAVSMTIVPPRVDPSWKEPDAKKVTGPAWAAAESTAAKAKRVRGRMEEA
jgi:hypothetical protein